MYALYYSLCEGGDITPYFAIRRNNSSVIFLGKPCEVERQLKLFNNQSKAVKQMRAEGTQHVLFLLEPLDFDCRILSYLKAYA